MSLKEKAIAAAVRAACGIRGGKLTKRARAQTLARFLGWCWEYGYQIRGLDSVRCEHIVRYINARRTDGKSTRTLQNERSHIVKTLERVGREGLANDPKISNASLGLNGASRKGTNHPVSEDALARILECALSRSAELYALVWLSAELGLRAQEAVRCGASLKSWLRQLESERQVFLVFGAKGGRTRHIIPTDRESTLRAVRFALSLMELHDSKSLVSGRSLRQAMHWYKNEWSDHLTPASGEHATPHSLRYRYAQRLRTQLLAAGLSEREADAVVAMCLGHGDGRGRYAKQVYFQHRPV